MCKLAWNYSVGEVERRSDRQFCPSWDGHHIWTGPGSRAFSLNYDNSLWVVWKCGIIYVRYVWCKLAWNCSVAEVERRGDRRFCPSWDGQHIQTGPGSRDFSLNYENSFWVVWKCGIICQTRLRNTCKLAWSCSITEVERRGDMRFCPSWDGQLIPTGPGTRNF